MQLRKPLPTENLKLALIGVSGAGKSVLADALLKNKKLFNAGVGRRSAIYIDYLESKSHSVNLEIQDYSCDELSRSITGAFYDNTHLAVFTLDSSQDFQSQQKWLLQEYEDLRYRNPGVVCLLAFTKSDLPKLVSDEELAAFKKKINVRDHVVCAMTIAAKELKEVKGIVELDLLLRQKAELQLQKRSEKQEEKDYLNTPPSSEGDVLLVPGAKAAQPKSGTENQNSLSPFSLIGKLNMPKDNSGKLTSSQRVKNEEEFNQFHLKNLAFLKDKNKDEVRFAALMKMTWDACDELELVLNGDLKQGMNQLFGVLNAAIAAPTFEPEAFQKIIKAWSASYKTLEMQAAEGSRRQHGAQERGIVRGIKDFGRAATHVWCEDLDLIACLKGIMVDPEEITTVGTYIIKPVNLAGSSFIKDKIQAVLKKKIEGPVDLLIPVQYGGHWRRALVILGKEGVLSATLWDSQSNASLALHPAYLNLQKAIDEIQAEQKAAAVVVTAISAGIQKNGWSCADYVMQNCLQQKGDLSDPLVKAICEVNPGSPDLLRKSIIDRILENDSNLKARYTPSLAAATSSEALAKAKTATAASNSVGFFRSKVVARPDPSFADAIFKELIENIETVVQFEKDLAMKSYQDNYLSAIKDLHQKTINECGSGSLSTHASVYVAESAQNLSEKVMAGSADAYDIKAFRESTASLISNYGWRVLVGAVVGAVVGIIVGAMIGIAGGPLAAVTALYCGVQMAIAGASFFGVLGMAAGTGLGIWRTINNDPLVQVEAAAETLRPRALTVS